MRKVLRGELFFCLVMIILLLTSGVIFGVLADKVFSRDDKPEETPVIADIRFVTETAGGFPVRLQIDKSTETLIGFSSECKSFTLAGSYNTVKNPNDEYEIPQQVSVIKIADSVFENNNFLKEIKMLSIQQIGKNGFKNAKTLNSVEVSSALSSIGEGAFDGCILLDTITGMGSLTSIPANAFRGCAKLDGQMVYGSGSAVYEPITFRRVTYIGQSAFRGCASLREVLFPAVEIIDELAFADCTALRRVQTMDPPVPLEINIPSKLHTIRSFAFANCTALRSFNSNEAGKFDLEKVKTIEGYNAFLNCVLLDRIFLDELVSLGFYAFQGCLNLSTVYMTQENIDLFANTTYFNNLSIQIGSVPAITFEVPPERYI